MTCRFSCGPKARSTLVLALLGVVCSAGTRDKAAGPVMPRFRWESITTANGLPNDRVYAVAVDGNRIWAGTDDGVALIEGGRVMKVFRPTEGLAQRACLSVSLDKKTHDLWVATMGGASRISGGRVDTFTQLSSGLANDVVYGVAAYGDEVWFATAAGASRLNLKTNKW